MDRKLLDQMITCSLDNTQTLSNRIFCYMHIVLVIGLGGVLLIADLLRSIGFAALDYYKSRKGCQADHASQTYKRPEQFNELEKAVYPDYSADGIKGESPVGDTQESEQVLENDQKNECIGQVEQSIEPHPEAVAAWRRLMNGQ